MPDGSWRRVNSRGAETVIQGLIMELDTPHRKQESSCVSVVFPSLSLIHAFIHLFT